MKFEVINDKGVAVMQTGSESCVPNEDELVIMNRAGYRFKVDGKIVTMKKLKEIGKGNADA